MAFSVVVIIITVLLFFVTTNRIRQYIINHYSGIVVSIIIAYVLRKGIIKIIFKGILVDKNGDMKSINAFSICFVCYMLFNIVLGQLLALSRLALFLLYVLVAVFRLDESLVPLVISDWDPAFYSYSAYLFFEHQTKNPVLRCAVECFAGSFVELSPNGLYRFSQKAEEVTGLSPVERAASSKSQWSNYGAIDERAPEPPSRDLSSRVRNRWLLAYTLVNNPDLIPSRRHPVEEDTSVDLEGRREVRVQVVNRIREASRRRMRRTETEETNEQDEDIDSPSSTLSQTRVTFTL